MARIPYSLLLALTCSVPVWKFPDFCCSGWETTLGQCLQGILGLDLSVVWGP